MDAFFKADAGGFNYRVVGIGLLDDHALLHKNVTDEHWVLSGG